MYLLHQQHLLFKDPVIINVTAGTFKIIPPRCTQATQQFSEFLETANSKMLNIINWPTKLTRLILMLNKPHPLGEQ